MAALLLLGLRRGSKKESCVEILRLAIGRVTVEYRYGP